MGLQNLSKEGLSSLLDKFQGKKLLVIGDLIVSRFVEVAARKLRRETESIVNMAASYNITV